MYLSISDTADSIEKLMSDPRLVELCELQKTGDEVLDVIRLSENQHSDILAWLLDPREGHGQGDEILRDLLISASTIANSGEATLDGRGTTASFFKGWTPSKIRTTGFGSAFTARELGMKRSERVDLFVIDTQNKFILIIENKAGTSHSKDQLDRYKNHFNEIVSKNKRLKDYAQVYIALDREYDEANQNDPLPSSYWLRLDYSWLKASAQRALLHVSRGNTAARLVMAYSNRQTEWEDPNAGRCSQLCAELHLAYPEAIRRIIDSSWGRAEKDWLTSKTDDTALLFSLQNKSAIAMLRETKGMVSVKAHIIEKLKFPKENLDSKRIRLYVCPEGCDKYTNEYWPVYIIIRHTEGANNKYKMTLCWHGECASSEAEAEYLRETLTQVDSRFSLHSNSTARKVAVNNGAELTLTEVLEEIKKINDGIKTAMKIHPFPSFG